MLKPSTRKNANERPEIEKAATLVVKRIREAILDEVFKPGGDIAELRLTDAVLFRKQVVRA